MDIEANPTNVIHKPPPLGSDQLNYLIWRYLQEAGYAEAAVKLQRDWKVDTDSLPFAKYIKGQALISLVQKGLRYHHLSLTVDENGQQTKALVPSMFYFGPETGGTESASAQKESMLKGSDSMRGVSPASMTLPVPRVKQRDATSIAHDDSSMPQPAKRGRKPAQSLSADQRPDATPRKVSGPAEADSVNGRAHQHATIPPLNSHHATENGHLTNGHHEDVMDVDNEVSTNITTAAPDIVMEEPIEPPLAPMIPTLARGESVAIQVAPAKVANLGPSSAILALDSSQIISRALWRPSDSAALIAQGESFCGVWNLNNQDLQPHSVKPLLHSLFPSGETVDVTACAWDPYGSFLALATYSEHSEQCQVHLFDGQDLELFESLPASRRPMTLLKWHPNTARLIGVALCDEGSEHANGVSSTILSWNVAAGQSLPAAPSPSTLTLPGAVLAIDCVLGGNSGDILLASEGIIYRCSNSDSLEVTGQWTQEGSTQDESWSFIKATHSSVSGRTIVAAASDSSTLWLVDRGILKNNIHAAPITGLEIRPRQQMLNGEHGTLEIATSSLDGRVKVWQIAEGSHNLTCTNQLQFEPASQAMCLSFSPDGFCLTAASYTTARVWNAQHNYMLMASWEGSEPEWKGSSIRDDDMASAGGRSSVNSDGLVGPADHTLTWHTDSKRLAFGLGSQVAVINFQR